MCRPNRAAARPCLIAGWKFWPFAHALTYSVVPLHLRVLWVDTLEVAWVAILSKTVARSKARAKTQNAAVGVEEEAEVAAEVAVAVTEEAEEDFRCDHILTCELPPLEEEDDDEEELRGLVSPTGAGGVRGRVGGS